jgi:hypothetical protein
MKTKDKLLKSIRRLILVFIVFLALSGITAFPLREEVNFLDKMHWFFPGFINNWINAIHGALSETPDLVLYGTDWLAFAHLVIAVNFIGPYRDPVRNIWVIQFGMIACLMVFPLALICGPIRGIPFFHQLIDCSFGLLGMIPLYSCYKKIKLLAQHETTA